MNVQKANRVEKKIIESQTEPITGQYPYVNKKKEKKKRIQNRKQ